MVEELDGLSKNDTFQRGTPLPGTKPIKTRFIFKTSSAQQRGKSRNRIIETRRKGIYPSFKAGLLRDTINSSLALPAEQGWKVKAVDFKQAYLIAALTADISLELPCGEVVRVCKVVYGLRQSAIE